MLFPIIIGFISFWNTKFALFTLLLPITMALFAYAFWKLLFPIIIDSDIGQSLLLLPNIIELLPVILKLLPIAILFSPVILILQPFTILKLLISLY